MSQEQVRALRRALIASETENAELRQQNIELEDQLDRERAVFKPREELKWPWGCLSVRKCIAARECASSCPTHAGRDVRACMMDVVEAAKRIRTAFESVEQTSA